MKKKSKKKIEAGQLWMVTKHSIEVDEIYWGTFYTVLEECKRKGCWRVFWNGKVLEWTEEDMRLDTLIQKAHENK